MAFDDDIALRPAGDGRFDAVVAEGWETPRGPLGGYVMALVLRAMEEAAGDPERQARTLNVHFLRPPHSGPVTIAATRERAGRSLSTVSARMEQDGKAIALALAAFSKPWPGPLLDDAPMPEVAPPEDRGVSVGRAPGGRRPPPFLERMTMQRRFGDPPFSGADHAETGGWLGLREERPIDAAVVAVLADAWFPAPWSRLREFAPAPTVEMTVHFRAPLPQPDGLLLGRFRTGLVRDGFFEEDGILWGRDGTLVAQSRQLGLLLGAS